MRSQHLSGELNPFESLPSSAYGSVHLKNPNQHLHPLHCQLILIWAQALKYSFQHQPISTPSPCLLVYSHYQDWVNTAAWLCQGLSGAAHSTNALTAAAGLTSKSPEGGKYTARHCATAEHPDRLCCTPLCVASGQVRDSLTAIPKPLSKTQPEKQNCLFLLWLT